MIKISDFLPALVILVLLNVGLLLLILQSLPLGPDDLHGLLVSASLSGDDLWHFFIAEENVGRDRSGGLDAFRLVDNFADFLLALLLCHCLLAALGGWLLLSDGA